MCLAIYKPTETGPNWKAYETGIDSNPDGWGFAVIDKGELLTACGMGGFEEFRHNFEPFSHCQSIIHFRWATHGTKDETNCHPFFVDDLAMIHNGIVNIDTASDLSRSDTWHFMEKVIAPMYRRDRDFFTRSEVIFNMELAHPGSKFAFLRQDGKVAIWNEQHGITEKDGHWYSNEAYLSTGHCYSARPTTSTRFTPNNTRDWAATLDTDEQAYLRYLYGQECGEESSYEADYSLKLEGDLLGFGFSQDCLREVQELLGFTGLEQLRDLI